MSFLERLNRTPAILTLAFLLTAAAGPAFAAEGARVLNGTVLSVADGEQRPHGGLKLGLAGMPNAVAETDAEGRFRLPLPSAAGPGDVVQLRLAEDGDAAHAHGNDYVDQPWDGAVRVPEDPDEAVEVRLTSAMPADLWSAERLDAFLSDFLVTSANVAGWRDPPNFTWEMDQWAHRHGVPKEVEHLDEVEAWIAAARAGKDPHMRGVADFVEARFADAARHLGEAADARLAALDADGASEEQRWTAVRALELEAAAQFRAEDDASAVETLRRALGLLRPGEAGLLRASLHHRLGLILHDQGRQGGDGAAQRLSEAVASFREALAARPKDELPDAWTASRIGLAAALADSGDLDGAVGGYEEVLAERPDETLAAHDLVKLQHNRVGDSAAAFQRMSDWLNAHPGDALGRVILVELFFNRGEWDTCVTMSDMLVNATSGVPGLAHYAVVLRVYLAASFLALDEPSEARPVVEELLAELDALGASFFLEWEFDGTLRTVRAKDGLPYKEEVVLLFEAAATAERDQVAARLRALDAKLPKAPAAPVE